MDRISLKAWKVFFCGLLVSALAFSQLGAQRLGQREIYPFFTWWLFASPPVVREDIVLQLLVWNGQAVNPPCLLNECAFLPPSGIFSPHGLVQEFGRSSQSDPARAAMLLADIKTYILAGRGPNQLRVLKRKVNALEFVLGKSKPAYESLGVVDVP